MGSGVKDECGEEGRGQGKGLWFRELGPFGTSESVPKTVPWKKSGEHEGGGAELRGLKSQMACFFFIYGAKGSH